MVIKKVNAFDIRKIRHRNLRQGKPFSTTAYKKDNEKKTFHLACIHNNITISCATFYPENNKFFPNEKSYRLRGMATDTEYRKRGIGRKLIERVIKRARDEDKLHVILQVDSNKSYLVNFYRRLGFNTYMKGIDPYSKNLTEIMFLGL